MNDEYQTRQFHGVTHFYEVLHGSDNKPVALKLTEPNENEIRFFKKTDEPKTTEIKL